MKQFVQTIAIAMIGGAFSLGGYHLMTQRNNKPAPSTAELGKFTTLSTPASSAMSGGGAPFDFVNASDKGLKAVVFISAVEIIPASNDPFDIFFGNGGGPQRAEGSGSGVIYSSDGYIVTNNHVVGDAQDLEVTLWDKRKFKAKLVGKDPSTDIAVIKIDAAALPTLKLANSDDTKIGQWVLAIGNPFELRSTVTAGIISAKGRDINIINKRNNPSIESFIQTDAAVNPGNSGGALIDVDGNLVGINTAIASRTGSYAGYSFAVPSNLVRRVADDLIQYGSSRRGYLGASVGDLSPELAQQISTTLTEGVYVESVYKGSAAEKAGLQPGDIITTVNNITVSSTPQLLEILGSNRPGDSLKMTVERNRKKQELTVTLLGK